MPIIAVLRLEDPALADRFSHAHEVRRLLLSAERGNGIQRLDSEIVHNLHQRSGDSRLFLLEASI